MNYCADVIDYRVVTTILYSQLVGCHYPIVVSNLLLSLEANGLSLINNRPI